MLTTTLTIIATLTLALAGGRLLARTLRQARQAREERWDQMGR